MGNNASIIQEFYKVRELWETIDRDDTWRLAIWSVEYADVDVVHKFMDIEQSPIGVFDDYFFRFDTRHEGDTKVYIQKLYDEFVAWFTPLADESIDILKALETDGYLTESFVPKENTEAKIEDLWNELLRFKSCLKEEITVEHFCLYFTYDIYGISFMSDFFNQVILTVPQGLRLVTMDMAQDSKIGVPGKKEKEDLYRVLHPELDMINAVKNDMYREVTANSTKDDKGRLEKQIMDTMESTSKNDKELTAKQVAILLSISNEIGTIDTLTTSYLVATQASYQVNNLKASEEYINKALELSKQMMEEDADEGYGVWRSCMLYKAAILHGKKQKKEAISIYEELNEKALEQLDIYYLMETYRLMGHLEYELSNHSQSLEYMLLALAAGAYLEEDMRLQSTYLHAAYMAHYLCKKLKSQKSVSDLEDQLKIWIGDNWSEILKESHAETAEFKMKKTWF